jgi:hypothetical protein
MMSRIDFKWETLQRTTEENYDAIPLGGGDRKSSGWPIYF